MDRMCDFRRLNAWQRAHQLVLAVYADSERFPASERFGLIPQLRRATLSIPTNIAEGAASASRTEFARYLGIAVASASEVEYLLLVCRDLGFMPQSDFESRRDHVEEVRRKCVKLRQAVRAG
jgi:four helix bundle protein